MTCQVETLGQQSKVARTYSVEELCEILDCSKKTVYSLCKKGLFASKMIGRQRRIVKSSFDEWFESIN